MAEIASGAAGALTLRAPKAAFAFLGVALLFAIGVSASVWAASGFTGFSWLSARTLALPVGVAAALAALNLRARLKRGAIRTHWDAIWRALSAFAAMGAAWPLSFGLSALLQGETGLALSMALGAIPGALIGAGAGLIGGAAAAYACLETAQRT